MMGPVLEGERTRTDDLRAQLKAADFKGEIRRSLILGISQLMKTSDLTRCGPPSVSRDGSVTRWARSSVSGHICGRADPF